MAKGKEGEGCGQREGERGVWPKGVWCRAWPRECRVRGVAKGSGGCNVVHVHLCTHLCVPRGGYSV